jgi:acyl-[acyl carrier protein]--UDP-N-acetylglucosamine O-acyltransferase
MLKSALVSVNRVFYVDRNSVAGHCCMYDYELISEILGINGFSEITKYPFRVGVDETLLIDVPSRKVESFYVEAEASEHPDAEGGSKGLISGQ